MLLPQRRLAIISLALASLLLHGAGGATIFVSPAGSDASGDGSAPWSDGDLARDVLRNVMASPSEH